MKNKKIKIIVNIFTLLSLLLTSWGINSVESATIPVSPSAYTLTTGYNGNFSNPQNAYSSNNVYATVTNGNRNRTFATNFRGFDFSSIPTGSTINSVTAYVELKSSTTSTQGQWRFSLWEDVTTSAALTSGVSGSIGNQQYTKSVNNTTDSYWSQTWGITPTLSELQSDNFGIRVEISHGNNGTSITYSVDDIYIVVDYTPLALPTVTTQSATGITETTASVNGNITNTGGESNTKRGFVYSISSQSLPGNIAPTLSGYTNYVEDTGVYGTGSFAKQLTGLVSGITYYVRAYSYNPAGYSYGNEVSFTTLALPIVMDPTVSSITKTSAVLGANVTWLGIPSSISARGIVYGITPNPTANATLATGTTTGVYTVNVSGLSCGTLYYYRGYATNSTGTSYSLNDSFTTDSCFDLPAVTTQEATSVTTSSATLNGTITDTGGENVTVRGFEYGEDENYGTTITLNGSFGIGSFTADISSLVCGVTYHYRSYATNSVGTSYGDNKTFTPGGLGPCDSSFAQADYRFFSNLNEADVGPSLGNQNTPVTLNNSGDIFRLRVLIKIEENSLVQNGEDFKLQYSEKVGFCDTSFEGENYVNVTKNTEIAYYDNFVPKNNQILINNINDPIPLSGTVVNQSYVESNNFTNSVSAIGNGNYGVWDLSLYDKSVQSNVSYCLRVVKADGELFDNYNFIPEITTAVYKSRAGGVRRNITSFLCNDGIDNDGDGLIDQHDPDCHLDGIIDNEYILDWNDESTPPSLVEGGDESGGDFITLPKCSDGLDNDGDTFIDELDSGCYLDGDFGKEYVPTHNSEEYPPVTNQGGGVSGGAGDDLGFISEKKYFAFSSNVSIKNIWNFNMYI